jgi:hypothetical protein
MISTSIIFSTGEKKWMPMNLLLVLELLGQRRDRQRRGVGGEDRVLADHRLRLGDGLGLDLAVLEHRLDDEVAVLERGVVGVARDARQQRVAVGLLGAALLDLSSISFGEWPCPCRRSPGRGRSAPRRCRPRRDIGDAGAHEAGADDADLLDLGRRHACGRRAPLFSSCIDTNSERIIAAASLRAQDLGESSATRRAAPSIGNCRPS